MKEKTNSFCFLLAFIHSSFVTLSMELSKKRSTSVFPDTSGFQINPFPAWMSSIHCSLFHFGLFYFMLYLLKQQ